MRKPHIRVHCFYNPRGQLRWFAKTYHGRTIGQAKGGLIRPVSTPAELGHCIAAYLRRHP